MSSPEVRCFHCGEPVPPGSQFQLETEDRQLPMCCAGCLAVAGLIFDSHLDRYYRFRQALARKAGDDLERAQSAWQSCDPNQALWGDTLPAGRREILLQTEGIRCAACAWLIRSQLEKHPGVSEVQVDIASGYTSIDWNPAACRLSDLAMALYHLGYKPHLPLAGAAERARQEERRRSLRRVGIAGLGMMQVMMYAVGLYAGDAQGIGEAARRFLEWVSLLVTTPVVLYSGRVFFKGAWRSLAVRRPGMDVPVALAIGVAYVASCINFFTGHGEVWFDSVVMFIFFLLLGRHVEMVLRHRNQQAGAVLARLLPEWAERITGQGTETVLSSDLAPGDRVRVRAGEAFPADGAVLAGSTEVNEALLTGESSPRARGAGDPVIAGSINLLQPVEFEVTAAGRESTVSALGRLLQKARASRSRTTVLAEKYASWFVVGVVLIALSALTWWYQQDASRALGVMLAVLVVSCPCAFSLAAPSAIAAASRALLKRGIILTRGSALEALAAADRAVFDKTGTLTSGRPEIEEIYLNAERDGRSQESLLDIAAALEAHSAHPLAHAFRRRGAGPDVKHARTVAGQGICGTIDGVEYRIGAAEFAGTAEAPDMPGCVWLADEGGWLARFGLRDTLREGARETVAYFRDAGVRPGILSGDQAGAVAETADRLGIEDWQAGLDPAAKLERMTSMSAAGAHVLMVGDGINDAPVLGAADVSIAVQGGAELANSAADMILTGRSLELVRVARETALSTRRIIAQNMMWAVAYNLTMIPLALSGALKPWMAALGMSASSLLVVLNAARLGRSGTG